MTESPVTLHHVAAAAGVSVATASRALTGKSRVSQSTVARVREAAAELGYRVDPVARALRAGSSRLVGMIVPVIGNPFFAELVDAVEERLQARGFELLLADSHGLVEEELRRLRVFMDRKVDGVILVPSDRLAPEGILQLGIPLVQVDRECGRSVADHVGVDNELGMALVLEHLVEIGVRTVAYVGADDATSNGLARWRAFEREAGRLGLEVTAEHHGAFDAETGSEAAKVLIDSELPEAIVCASDLIAFGLVGTLWNQGVRVPDDVLVTGFDGTYLSRLSVPNLTSVTQPVDAIADGAISFLMDRMDDASRPVRRNRIAPELAIGNSTSRTAIAAGA